jgi:hypothetical protein
MKHTCRLPGGFSIYSPPVTNTVRCFTRLAALTWILFARPRDGGNEFGVFLGDEVFARAG